MMTYCMGRRGSWTMIDGFDLDAVTIKDEYYMEAMRADINFIKKFDKDRVLAGFRKTAGIDTKGAKVYQGWEDSLIGGHCLGHYLTAAAQAVKLTDDSLLKSNLEYIICGLRECQEKLGNGFLSAATVEDTQNVYRQFDIEEGKNFYEEVKKRFEKRICGEVKLVQIGATIAVHTGPFAIGIGCIKRYECYL